MVITEDKLSDKTVVGLTTPVLKKGFSKATLTFILIGLLAASFYITYSIYSKYEVTKSELAASQSLYGIVVNEKARLDSLVGFYQHSIGLRDTVIAIKDKQITKQTGEIASLRKGLSNALIQASTATASESYTYINNRIPATAPKIYPFDSTQVKTIHKTFLERDGYLNISAGLDSIVKNLKLLSFTKDNQIGELKSLNNVYQSKLSISGSENTACQTEVKGLQKEIKRQKLLKGVSDVGLVGLVAIVVALIL